MEIPANPAIHSLGFETVTDAVGEFCKTYPTLPFVSVGSGLALVERVVRARVSQPFFLVDPAPSSYYPFCKQHYHRLVVASGMPMTHSYTHELFDSNPELAKGDSCLLFLNWCDYGGDDYDLEAILLLKPRAIFVICDLYRSAGSQQFHHFLKTNKLYKPRKVYSVKQAKKETYECSHETISMQWLVRSHVDLETVGVTLQCLQTHDESNKQNIQVLATRKEEATCPQRLFSELYTLLDTLQ